MSRRGWRAWAGLLTTIAGLAAVGLAGCKSTAASDDKLNDSMTGFNEKLRPAGKHDSLDGLSNKSQQIERNLGF